MPELRRPSSSFDLSSAALVPLNQSLSGSSTSRSYTIYLLLAGNSLPAGLSKTFSLTCQLDSGISSSSSITVQVNSPPLPGSFLVDPSSGYEFASYSFLCSKWQDVDLPISYEFSYISVTNSRLVLRSRAELTFASLILTAGLQPNYTVSCIAQIFDGLSASSQASYDIQVNPRSDTDSSALLSSFLGRVCMRVPATHEPL
jgi:hypothetical protein